MNYIEEFKKHCIECYPQEACGYVVANTYIPVDNTHSDPLNYFSFPLEVTQTLLGKDYKVLHSHTVESYSTDPRVPSLEDMQGQVNTGVPWGIVHCDGENITDILWYGPPSEVPLLDRKYISNVQDCFTLARDYLYSELAFDVGLHPRPTDWETWNPHYILQTYEKLGFFEVPAPQSGDILLFTIGSRYINHIGIYLGQDNFIHHLYNRTSSKDSLSKWSRHLTKVIRYNK